MLGLTEIIEKEVTEAISFIKEALKEKPEHIEIEPGKEEKELLLLDKNLDQLSFNIIPELSSENKVAAVDGGSATVLKTRSFLIGVYRAGYVIFQKGKRVKEKFIPLKMEILSLENKAEKYLQAYQELVGEVPNEVPELDKILDRLRLFAEWGLVRELLAELEEDDMILVDGSLRASIVPPYELLLKVTEEAEYKNIHLAGVTKTSTLYWGKKSPLIPMVVKSSEKFCPESKWFCRLSDLDLALKNPNWFGTIYISRLKASSDYAFRVDMNRLDNTEPEKIFSWLSNLSSDPAYLGYPYPLAAVHNRVRVLGSEVEDIKYRLQSKALEKGISSADWDLLFRDFHEILNADLNK
ncbi:MAG: DNA double-strand break repair nuclease NurA [candidate division Zixibacteria bacterium]|nr:DNA double-strand break repair nuclease NurA [candidate division Zixibacteria bacterium]